MYPDGRLCVCKSAYQSMQNERYTKNMFKTFISVNVEFTEIVTPRLKLTINFYSFLCWQYANIHHEFSACWWSPFVFLDLELFSCILALPSCHDRYSKCPTVISMFLTNIYCSIFFAMLHIGYHKLNHTLFSTFCLQMF